MVQYRRAEYDGCGCTRFILKSVEATTSADWDAILSTNVKGYAFATKHAIRVMKQRGGGSSSRLCE